MEIDDNFYLGKDSMVTINNKMMEINCHKLF